MDPTAPEWFVTEYEQGVLHVFQDRGGKLANRNVCRRKTVTKAEDAKFNITGILNAYLKPIGELTPQRAEKSNIIIPHARWKVSPVIDRYDLDQMNADDRDEAQKAGGMALGRKADDILIAALDSNAATPLGGSGTFMSPVLANEITETLALADVDDDLDVYAAISPKAWSQLMRFKEFTSADYNGPDLPYTSQVRRWMRTWNGIHWIKHNRLSVDTNIRTCHAWVREALGCIDMGDPRAIMTWENPKDHWFINMEMTMGADLLLPEGAVPFEIDETIAPLDIDPEAYTVA